MSEHTPTPWRQGAAGDKGYSVSIAPCHIWTDAGPGNGLIATTCPWSQPAGTQQRADAAFIVKAVNSHDALVKKLEEIHDITQDTTLSVECWQKLQNIAATAASALASIKEPG